MQEIDARRILGVTGTADADQARTAYRARLLRTHPDVSGSCDATERTVELTRAYRLVMARLATGAPADVGPPDADESRPSRPSRPSGKYQPSEPREVVLVAMVDTTTIGVGAPPNETVLILVDAANELGEISYLDLSAGLLEGVVEFIEAPTSSVLLSVQGRATGITEVFCTVEPLSGGEAPPSDAVTRLLFRTLVEMAPTV